MELKRAAALVLAAGVCFSFAVASDDKPAMPTKDSVKDATKQVQDGIKKTADDAKKMIEGKAPEGKQPEMNDPKMAEMMASMTPGEHHTHLAKFAGEWDVKSKMWMDEGAPPMESTATVSAKMEMGGRFLHINYNGDMMGQPFHGVSMMGYNNNSKQHESIWVDNMSTSMWFSTGTCSADGKTYTMSGTFVEPDGEKKTTREITSWTGADTYTMEFYETGKEGKEHKMMELSYTRKSGATTTKPEIKAPEIKKPEISK